MRVREQLLANPTPRTVGHDPGVPAAAPDRVLRRPGLPRGAGQRDVRPARGGGTGAAHRGPVGAVQPADHQEARARHLAVDEQGGVPGRRLRGQPRLRRLLRQQPVLQAAGRARPAQVAAQHALRAGDDRGAGHADQGHRPRPARRRGRPRRRDRSGRRPRRADAGPGGGDADRGAGRRPGLHRRPGGRAADRAAQQLPGDRGGPGHADRRGRLRGAARLLRGPAGRPAAGGLARRPADRLTPGRRRSAPTTPSSYSCCC